MPLDNYYEIRNFHGMKHSPSVAADAHLEAFADRLGALMPRLMRGMIGQERNHLARGLLTLPQLWLLETVAAGGACTMGEIAREFRLTASTVTGMVDRLARMGLLRRVRDARDRRTVRAGLTTKGRRLLDGFHAEKRRMTIHMFRRIPAEERAAYLRVVEQMVGNLPRDEGGAA